MEVRPNHLRCISCEVVLFNRQRLRLSNQKIRRIIIDFSGKQRVIHTKELRREQDLTILLKQIKSIYFDKKMIAVRGYPEVPLEVSNHNFFKMERRQILLNNARKQYLQLQKEEWSQWCKMNRKYAKTNGRTS